MLRLLIIWGWMVLLLICLVPGGRAGERIEFSSTRKTTESMRRQSDDKKLERLGQGKGIRQEFDLLNVVEVPAVETGDRHRPLNKEEAEMMSWRNSWIFVTPKSMNHQPTAEEVFNIQQLGPDGLPKKKLTTMEKFLKEKDGGLQKKEGATEAESEDQQTKDSADRNSARPDFQKDNSPKYARADDPREETSRRSDSMLKDLFAPPRRDSERASGNMSAGEGAASSRMENDPLLRGRPAGKVMDGDYPMADGNQSAPRRAAEFQQMLNNRGGGSASGDAINQMGDSTRNPANPTTPRPYQMLERSWYPSANSMQEQMPSAARLPAAADTSSLFQPPPPVVQPPPKLEDKNSRYQPLVLPMPRRQR